MLLRAAGGNEVGIHMGAREPAQEYDPDALRRNELWPPLFAVSGRERFFTSRRPPQAVTGE